MTRFRYRKMIEGETPSFTYLLYFTCLTGWYAEETCSPIRTYTDEPYSTSS